MDLLYNKKTLNAGVLELVDEVDSKSIASDGVRVRFPPPVPKNRARSKRTLFFGLRRAKARLRSDLIL